MKTVLSKLPIQLPLQTRVEAIEAHEQLNNDKIMEAMVRGIMAIVEIARKSDPGKSVVSLIGNAIVGRFNLAWLLIKKYKAQEATDQLPPNLSAFLPDPRYPHDVCLFKLTLYNVRNLIRLFEKTLSACAEIGIMDYEQPPKKKKNKTSGEEVVMEVKPKK